MEISLVLQRCFRHGIKVYPVCVRGKWKIRAEVNGKKVTFHKVLTGKKEVNEAMEKTYRFYYEKL